MVVPHRAWLALTVFVFTQGCGACGNETAPSPPPLAGPSAAPTDPSAANAVPLAPVEIREGQAMVRSPDSRVLYVADEDHKKLRRVALTDELRTPPPMPAWPEDNDAKRTPDPSPARFGAADETSVELPGRPAQVFALGTNVLVTIRDPGLLMIFEAGPPLKEVARISLPDDAWGIAVSPAGDAAYVTSAWTHQLTRVDVRKRSVDWSVDVAREPRGVTVSSDGETVYVSHLVGRELTRVNTSGGPAEPPTVERFDLPPDPLRSIASDQSVSASLGYALIHSPDGRRLFAARHALGTMWGWQGNPTVDVYSTVLNEPIAPLRSGRAYGQLSDEQLLEGHAWSDHAGVFVQSTDADWTQPRAMVFRQKTRHLLVASESTARLVELDAMSIAPGILENRYYRLGGLAPEKPTEIRIPPHCGAPSAIALSEDEDVAWVYCRSTDNIAAVRLTSDGHRGVRDEIEYIEHAAYQNKLSPWGPFAFAQLSVPAPADDHARALNLGRRLFFDGIEPVMSQGQGCAGCHPDGRDDGHVWREVTETNQWTRQPKFRAGPTLARASSIHEEDRPFGMARQTPMLAGRVKATGPYGWHNESPTLTHRIRAGFQLHRFSDLNTDGKTLEDRAVPLALFLREGLVTPPRTSRALTPAEERGKVVFELPETQCATCHVPKTEFTDRNAAPLRGFRTLPLFTEDPNRNYKVPSLLFVGGTPPYYHDGSLPTLEALIDTNHDRMGRTSQLSDDDRNALVAYLRTL